jgi:hypothetical protein
MKVTAPRQTAVSPLCASLARAEANGRIISHPDAIAQHFHLVRERHGRRLKLGAMSLPTPECRPTENLTMRSGLPTRRCGVVG